MLTKEGSPILPSPSFWQLQICFMSLSLYCLSGYFITGVIQYLAFCVWLLSLSLTFSRFAQL